VIRHVAHVGHRPVGLRPARQERGHQAPRLAEGQIGEPRATMAVGLDHE
jgi:hypothetical protein